ncbi:unnamed protein product [Oreochromis niloticus]|nr:unnamed protein product [Mustela putorius furo]
MSAAAVLPVSQRWGVNLHMNQLPDATLRELNQVLKTRVNQGYTKNHGGKSHDHDSAPQIPGSAVQMMVVAKTMCEIFIIMANGQRCLMLLRAIQLQVMIVSIFKQKVQKMLNEKGCTEKDFKLHVNGSPLDDDSAPVTKYGIKTGSIVQMVIMVHGG